MRFLAIGDAYETAPRLDQFFDEACLSDWLSPGDPLLSFRYQRQVVTELHIARLVASWLGNWDSCMIWIAEFGIWPSHENLHLMRQLRTSYGESASLAQKPVHLFYRGEQDDFITFLELALRFGWGGRIAHTSSADTHERVLWFTHDGVFNVRCDTDESASLISSIESVGLEALSP